MAVTEEDLKNLVKATAASDAFVKRCFDTASALVTAYVGTQEIPEDVRDMAILLTGQSLFSRRDKAEGVPQWTNQDGAPLVRPARDPMTAVYPLLDRYMVRGF